MAQSDLKAGIDAVKISSPLVCKASKDASPGSLGNRAGWKADQPIGMGLARLIWCLNDGN